MKNLPDSVINKTLVDVSVAYMEASINAKNLAKYLEERATNFADNIDGDEFEQRLLAHEVRFATIKLEQSIALAQRADYLYLVACTDIERLASAVVSGATKVVDNVKPPVLVSEMKT